MTRRFAFALLIACALSGLALAQHQTHGSAADHGATTSLAPDAVKGLLAGDGMGLARPAELNRYPGPKHVLELKDALALTAEQAQQVEAIRQQMLTRAQALGKQIVHAERSLDEAFRSGSASAADIEARTAEIARLQGELRYVHLHAHLLTKPLLSAEQVEKYSELRKTAHGGH